MTAWFEKHPDVRDELYTAIRPEADKTAVLVQLMIQPVAAGVVFTINPVTGAGDQLVINSSWGLGEALVSGQIEPPVPEIARTGNP